VDAASAARVRRDELRDQWGGARAVVQGEAALTVAHNGSVYELLFFPDQAAEQRPYDVLRTVQSDGVPSAFSRVGEHHWHDADDADDAEAGDAPAEDAEAHAPTNARRVVALPAPLAHMVHELLRPHNLPEFLRRHDALAMLMRRETRVDGRR
jgi:hemin uptake protein HemP